MFGRVGLALCLILNMAAGLSPAPTWAAEVSESPKVDEIQVRFKNGSALAMSAQISGVQRAMDTSARVGESFAHVRSRGRLRKRNIKPVKPAPSFCHPPRPACGS